jgi:sarcosine oxidase
MGNTNYFDVIVTGAGSMGAAACYYLAKQGGKTLGLDQFQVPHDQGAHAGQSRIIRKAYFEHPDYVPLLNRAYENWTELEKATGEKLYHKTGLVYFGGKNHPVIKGVRLSAEKYAVPLQYIPAQEREKRFPQFNIPDQMETIFEPDAGFLPPEKSIALYIQQAEKLGAIIRTNEKALDWKKDGEGIKVTTAKDVYRGGRLIITAGPWAGKMIPGMETNLKITRQTVAWIKPKHPEKFSLKQFFCWMIAEYGKPGVYYGFPMLSASEFGEPVGLKMAYHHPGDLTDPDDVNRNVTEQETNKLIALMNNYFPGEFSGVSAVKTCLYASSPDENFIIDFLPGYENKVAIACGFSGHGFKFASVVGEILADLALKGKTDLPMQLLNAERISYNLRYVK